MASVAISMLATTLNRHCRPIKTKQFISHSHLYQSFDISLFLFEMHNNGIFVHKQCTYKVITHVSLDSNFNRCSYKLGIVFQSNQTVFVQFIFTVTQQSAMVFALKRLRFYLPQTDRTSISTRKLI